MRRFPNFYLVGAPKCGTTSLAHALGQHPEIFAPVVKEPGYFGDDLRQSTRLPLDSYRQIYRRWSSEKYALDASAIYLCSTSAAAEIRAASPDARILVMTRDPAEAALSLYNQNRYGGIEPLGSFEEALAAEEERARQPNPPKHGTLELLLYTRMYRYAEQIDRYVSAFGPDRVHVAALDDFKTDPDGEMAKVWAFLDLPPHPVSFEALNPGNKHARFLALQHFISRPPKWAGRVAFFIPKEWRLRIRGWLRQANTFYR